MEAAAISDRIERARRSSRAERLRARGPRYVFVGAVAVLALVGLRELVVGHPVPAAPKPPLGAQDVAMEGFATEFARAYLTYDGQDLESREDRLASFVPTYLGPDAGFTPAGGSQLVLWAHAAQNQEAIAGGRIVTVAVQTDTHSAPVYLAVPVERQGGKELTLAGYPSFVGPPAAATAVDEPTYEKVVDPALEEMAIRVVTNYLSRSAANLQADLSQDAAVSLPTAPLQLSSASEVVWADGPNGAAVLVSVEASDEAGGAYSLVYELGVANQGERWYAQWIEVVPDAR